MARTILIVGSGIAGLSCAIALRRLGHDVTVFDKVRELRDAGSGMSVIGHSLLLLRALGVDMASVGLKQEDVTLRHCNGTVLFDVPLMSDAELVREFGSVQYNVHRGELQQALLRAFEREGGRVQTGCKFVSFLYDTASSVAATFANLASGEEFVRRGCLLVGADGVHSAVRRCMFPDHRLHYSGSSCWRGIAASTPPPPPGKHPQCMFKTVVHPTGNNVSFTSGYTTRKRCFWVLDVVHKQNDPIQSRAATEFVLEHMEHFHPSIRAIVEATPSKDLIQTDVFDSNPVPCTDRRAVVLIGDAAHAVVHHFGQGACLAVEDAVRLSQCVATKLPPADTPEDGSSSAAEQVAAALRAFDSWSAWGRTWTLMFVSRWCGWFYLRNGVMTNTVLRVCLTKPFCLVFALLMRVLLFVCQRDLRAFVRHQLPGRAPKR
eukprot:m.99845 g.99845  ORF g.99845 m.99845 type:complete len:433 (-) comp15362_c0_seq2:25-1323(-)